MENEQNVGIVGAGGLTTEAISAALHATITDMGAGAAGGAAPDMPAVETDVPKITDTKDPLWYLKVEGVTAEDSNETLGITKITIFDRMSDTQRSKGILCKVTLRTTICTVSGITVFCKKLPEPIDGHQYALNVMNPSRFVEGKDGAKGDYKSDVFLTATTRAQIACHIQSRLC